MKKRKDMEGASITIVYDVMLAKSRDRQRIDMSGSEAQIGCTWLLGWVQHQEAYTIRARIECEFANDEEVRRDSVSHFSGLKLHAPHSGTI